MYKRPITPFILKNIPRKIVLLSGPRQVGKTTQAKSLMSSFEHLNYDTKGRRLELYFLRNKDGNEIDFAVVEKNKILAMLAVKWSDAVPTKSFLKLKPKGQSPQAVQLVVELDKEIHTRHGVKIIPVKKWLKSIEFT